jgi:thioredoxin 1
VRATGGLDDTIEQYDAASGQGTGFKFTEYSGAALLETVERAMGVFADRAQWKRLTQTGMKKDFSWGASAREYVKLYGELAGRPVPEKDAPKPAAKKKIHRIAPELHPIRWMERDIPCGRLSAMAGNTLEVTDQTFDQEVLKSDQPVLVDFWAAWCGPCRMIAPTVEALAQEYLGKAKVAKVNVDENQMTPTQYNVRGIPTLLLFKGGKVQEQIVGAASRDAIESMIKKHL